MISHLLRPRAARSLQIGCASTFVSASALTLGCGSSFYSSRCVPRSTLVTAFGIARGEMSRAVMRNRMDQLMAATGCFYKVGPSSVSWEGNFGGSAASHYPPFFSLPQSFSSWSSAMSPPLDIAKIIIVKDTKWVRPGLRIFTHPDSSTTPASQETS